MFTNFCRAVSVLRLNVKIKNQKNMKYLVFSILTIAFASCEKRQIDNLNSNLPLDTEVQVSNGFTLNNLEEDISLTMQSVANDSRCPSDVECVWSGDAEVNFVFRTKTTAYPFVLHTDLTPKDTLLGDYTITLRKLDPHPVSTAVIQQADYKATIIVSREN